MSWISAVILNIPLFLTIYFDKKVDFCMEYWPQPEWLPKAYSSTWFFVAGIIPITLMTVLYSRVVHSLWFKRRESTAETAGNTQQVFISHGVRETLYPLTIFNLGYLMPILTREAKRT